jgi:hypothetical protein
MIFFFIVVPLQIFYDFPFKHRYSGSGNEYYCKTVSDRLPLTAVRKTGNTPLLFSVERHPRVSRRIACG